MDLTRIHRLADIKDTILKSFTTEKAIVFRKFVAAVRERYGISTSSAEGLIQDAMYQIQAEIIWYNNQNIIVESETRMRNK